ncbi:MAG: AsmA family protein [Rhizobiaceae bacterium]
MALTAVLVVPYFIDWTSYKADFEREASRILGREVVVRGDARARLLPLPSVTFTDVEVAGAEPDKPAITVETFSMDAELAPFLRGELLIFDMRIERPKARIAIDENGTVDWALRPSTPFDAGQVTLEKVSIIEGRIDVDHSASGRTHELTEVNADISARTLAGPWRMTGSMRVDGSLTALSVSTGALEDTGTMRLRVRAEPERYGFGLETDGHAGLSDGVFGYDGTFRLEARKAERLRGAEGETFELAESVEADNAPPAYRVSGDFSLNHEKIDVGEFRFETGPVADPYVANGQASIALGTQPRFDISADGAQLRFQDVKDAEDGSLALSARLAAFKEVMFDLPKPEIPGTIEVKLPAIVAGDTTVRNVTLSAEPVEKGWAIASASATLPGRATLEGNGFLNATFGEFGFTGNLLLAVAQPSGFAAWLSKDVDEALRRLPAAGFEAAVELTEVRQVFTGLELRLGDAAFSGRIVNEQPADRRPSMLVELDGGALDVEGLAAFASLFVDDSGATRLSDHDLDFKIKAGPVTVSGITAQAADTAMRLRDGRLEIDRLALSGVEGASISATGSLDDVGGSPVGKLGASVIAGDLAPLIILASERFPDNTLLAALSARAAAFPGIYGDANLDLDLDLAKAGEGQRLAFNIKNGTLGGSTIDLGLTATGELDDPYAAKADIFLTASNDEPGAVYALYGIPALPFGFAGALGTELEIAGVLKDGAAATFRAAGDGITATFEGTVSADAARFAVNGDGKLDAEDLEPYLMTAGVTLPGMGLGVPASLSANLDLADGVLIASGLSGTVGGNALNGDINATVRDGLPHFTGALNMEALDLGLVVAAVLGEASMDMEAGGVWPRIPFEPAARPPFTAELELNASSLTLNGIEKARNAKLSGRLNREGARLTRASADYFGGTIGGLVELSNNGGTGLLSGQIRIADAPLSELVPGDGIKGTADLSASLTANGKSIEGMMASLSGSGTATVRELEIPGFAPDALSGILTVADEAGTEIDTERTAAFAPAMIQGGTFAAEASEFAITIAGGVLRAPPVVLSRPEASLTVEARADLGSGTVGASGELIYDAGLEAVVGAEPAVRFEAEGEPGAVQVKLDIGPLAQFLTQRALEREQARVEAMQAQLLERQRLRREVRYYASLQFERDQLAEEQRREEEEARAAQEARKAAQEAEARRQAEEAARLKAEQEARRAAELEAQLRANEAVEEAPDVEREPLPPPSRSNLTLDGLLRAIEE